MNKSEFMAQDLRRTVVVEGKGVSPGDQGQLALVMFLWALCFPLISIGLKMAPPLTFAALRSFVAGGGLLLLAFGLRRPWPQGWAVWLTLLGVGLSLTSIGFGGMFLAGGLISPGLATVLANIQPLIAAALAGVILGEVLGPRRRWGLFIGFAGIILAALPGFGGSVNSSPAGVAFILLGAAGVAVGNVLLKRLAGQVDILMATGWQFILGGAPLWLLAQQVESPAQVVWNPSFMTVLLVLGLLGTSLALALWFSLLHRSELNRLNTFTFLTPVFALMIGALFFGESLGLVEMAGIALILAGVLWVSRQGPSSPLADRPPYGG